MVAEDTTSVVGGARSIQPGRRIGKYEILQHVATGGMAEIYLARATGIEQFKKLCVIKRILPAAAGNADLVKMLLDEARIAATLHHSNIVQVFDIGQADGEFFIAMEYLHGRDVQAIVRAVRQRGERLAEDHALSIALGVCAGLHYAHDKTDEHDRPLNIVHRDVSPTNVIVTYDGGVKLVDFGLVKAEGRATESRSGSLKGKLAYMSPEQCRSKPCDRRSDVFSLSIMLWELTTGARLYTGECDYDYLTAILERPPASPSSVVPEYAPQLEAIVMKGLARDPAERYQTAEELQIDLEDYCRERKLKISPITLRRMMEDLFGEEMRSMQSALREGVALEDHIVGSLALGSASAVRMPSSVPTSPDVAQSRSSAPRRRAPWIAGFAAVAAAGVGGWYVARGSSSPPDASATKPEPSATSNTPAAKPDVTAAKSDPSATTDSSAKSDTAANPGAIAGTSDTTVAKPDTTPASSVSAAKPGTTTATSDTTLAKPDTAPTKTSGAIAKPDTAADPNASTSGTAAVKSATVAKPDIPATSGTAITVAKPDAKSGAIAKPDATAKPRTTAPHATPEPTKRTTSKATPVKKPAAPTTPAHKPTSDPDSLFPE